MSPRLKVYQLADELGVHPNVILGRCKSEGVGEGVRWPTQIVSHGLAQTVRQWHRDGYFKGLSPNEVRAAAHAERYARRLWELNLMADSLYPSEWWGGLDILEAVAARLGGWGVSPQGRLGRRFLTEVLLWLNATSDFNKWHRCEMCGLAFVPSIDASLVKHFLGGTGVDFFACGDCGGLRYDEKENPGHTAADGWPDQNLVRLLSEACEAGLAELRREPVTARNWRGTPRIVTTCGRTQLVRRVEGLGRRIAAGTYRGPDLPIAVAVSRPPGSRRDLIVLLAPRGEKDLPRRRSFAAFNRGVIAFLRENGIKGFFQMEIAEA